MDKKWYEKDKNLKCDYRQQKRLGITDLSFKKWLEVKGYK